MARALIYTRVSQDRAQGRSPEEQEAEAREVCEREGWDVVEVITDSVGASRHSKGTRSGWAQARAMVRSRKVDVLVTWEASRAQRDLSAYAELRDLCVASGVRWSYSGRTYDLTDHDDRFRTGLDALMAEREADETAHRVQRAMRANAVKGRPHGRRLFGYQRVYDPASGALVGQEPHPMEALIVQRIFDEYLGGGGIRRIARRLNEDGITTGTGARWADTQVKRVLTNPAYAARRVHRGEVVTDADWPALIDLHRFELAQARLASKRGTRQASTARLLTAVGRCGRCGGKLHVIHDRSGRDSYTCSAGYCTARDLVKLDAYVSDLLLERVRTSPPPEPDLTPDPARQRVDALRGQLDEAVAEFTAGRLTAATLGRVEAALLPQIAEAERSVRPVVPLEITVPEDVEGWWATLDAEGRREFVGAHIAAVTLLPTVPGRRVFDPSAVRVEFRN